MSRNNCDPKTGSDHLPLSQVEKMASETKKLSVIDQIEKEMPSEDNTKRKNVKERILTEDFTEIHRSSRVGT